MSCTNILNIDLKSNASSLPSTKASEIVLPSFSKAPPTPSATPCSLSNLSISSTCCLASSNLVFLC